MWPETPRDNQRIGATIGQGSATGQLPSAPDVMPVRYTDVSGEPPHTGPVVLETCMRGESPENQANRPTVLPLSFRLC
jgi:hypothetical protein